MVMVEYQIEPHNVTHFTKAIQDLRRIRYRDGAFFWSLFKDIESPNKFITCFMVESWIEHLRQHERISNSDREIIEKVSSFHIGKEPPKVTHFVAENLKGK